MDIILTLGAGKGRLHKLAPARRSPQGVPSLSAFNVHTEGLAAGAGAQGFSLENGQAPLAIAPRDVSHGTNEGHIFPAGEAGKVVLVLHAHQSMKERKKTTFSLFACSTTKKPPTFCVILV